MKERLVTCNEEDTDGRARVTRDEERVLLSIGTLQKELKSLVVSSIGTCTLLNRNHINV